MTTEPSPALHPIAEHIEPDPAVLAERLAVCLSKWRLTNRGELSGGFRSAVFDCVSANGVEAVLKLPPTAYEAHSEAAALRLWAGTGGAVELLNFDDDLDALLLARIQPGAHFVPLNEESAIAVAADILSRLHTASPNEGRVAFLSFEELYPAWEHRSLADLAYERETRGEPQRAEAAFLRMDDARQAALELCATASEHTVLHGDICAKNLLWDGQRYVAIDPIPRMGERCSEIGFFAASYPLPVSGVFERAEAIARRLGCDAARSQRWAAVWAVHQGCQAWRPDQGELDALCASEELAAGLNGFRLFE